MLNSRRDLLLVIIVCLASIVLVIYLFGQINFHQLQDLLRRIGIWAPIIYISVYIIATSLLMPSTPLNVTGGAVFGLWFGLLWASGAAVIAALASFAFTRTFGREFVAKKMAGRWEAIDAEMQGGGLWYTFAVRLLPLIPHGLINYSAGLTSVRFKDYLLGTIPGTILGVLPPVLIGSSGLKAATTGDILPLVAALALTGIAVAAATLYRRHRTTDEENPEGH